jgi:hypothetical protein
MKSVHPSVRGAAVRLFVLLFVAGPALALAGGCLWPGAAADKEAPKEEEPTSAAPRFRAASYLALARTPGFLGLFLLQSLRYAQQPASAAVLAGARAATTVPRRVWPPQAVAAGRR